MSTCPDCRTLLDHIVANHGQGVVQKLSVTGNCTGTQLQGKMPVLHYYMGGCCISTIHSPGYMIRAFVLGL